MDEARLKIYVDLIEQLLACPQGQEMALLQGHPDLMTQELLTVMGQVAQMLRVKGKPNADWLDQVAQRLTLFITEDTIQPENSLVFMQQTLQVIVSSEGNLHRIHPWLVKHLPCLNADLLQVLPSLEQQVQESGEPKSQRLFAMAIGVFANVLLEFPYGERSLNLHCAALGYEIAGRLFEALGDSPLSTAAQESLVATQKELQALQEIP